MTLISPDIKILIKEGSDPKTIAREDTFMINEAFVSKLKRLNINKSIKTDHNLKEE